MPTTVGFVYLYLFYLFIKIKNVYYCRHGPIQMISSNLLKVKNAYYCRHNTWNIVEANPKFIEVKMFAIVRLKGCEYNGNL